MRFNTGSAATMVFVNLLTPREGRRRRARATFALLLGPWAPHQGEEEIFAVGRMLSLLV